MSGFGSMITFETGSLKNANKMLKKLRVCSLGESLGGVETLISHPATMTHAGLGRKGTQSDRHHRRHGAHLGRHRRYRRHSRRSGIRAGRNLEDTFARTVPSSTPPSPPPIAKSPSPFFAAQISPTPPPANSASRRSQLFAPPSTRDTHPARPLPHSSAGVS